MDFIYRVSHIEMRYHRLQKKIENEQFIKFLKIKLQLQILGAGHTQ